MKLQLITNEEIVKDTLSISEIEEYLREIRSDILIYKGRLTIAQARKIDSTPLNKIIGLYGDDKLSGEFAYKISTQQRRYNAILKLIKLYHSRELYSDMLHDRKYHKNKFRLISNPKSETDIIRERLKSFGNSLRSRYCNEDGAESIRNTIRKSRRW